jgi:hypothetical protein
MPLIDYKPEVLTHPNSSDKRVAPFGAGELFFSVAGPQVIDRTLWNNTLKSEEYGEKMHEYLDRGVFVVLDNDDHPSLKDDNPTKAVALVKDCFDLKLLEAWREDESRPTVIKALEAKIKDLTPPPSKKEA